MGEKTLENKIRVIKRTILKDDRGWFLKVIKGDEEDLPQYTGEIYLTSAHPNQVKGSHYHAIANEWFTLLTGKAILRLKDMKTDEEMCLSLDSSDPFTVFVPPYIAHRFDNNSTCDYILLAYTDKYYDPEDTIAYIFE